MANVNRGFSDSGIRQFSRLFVACRDKIYIFTLTIYSRLFRSVTMLVNETSTYQVTVLKLRLMCQNHKV